MKLYKVCYSFDFGDYEEKKTISVYAASKFDAILYVKELYPGADYVFILSEIIAL